MTDTREYVQTKIQNRLIELDKIQQLPKNSFESFDKIQTELEKWDDYTISLLKKLFNNTLFSEKFVRAKYGFVPNPGYNITGNASELLRRVEERRDELQSILSQLELLEEKKSTSLQELGTDVFIVHGHDNEAKLEVARTIEKLGLNTVILHEKPNKGRTVIEKLVEESKSAGFAVILLTPDDVGTDKGKQIFEERARQNVVLELGYFIGKLGRARVCALLKGGIQIPTDFSGVVYIPMDNAGKWKLDLVNELKEANFKIDYSKIS